MRSGDAYRYADVVLPLMVPTPYTYSIPNELSGRLRVGMRVVVPLRETSRYVGIVWALHNARPDTRVVRSVELALDEQPMITQKQRELWKWIAQYYLCSLGEVLRASLPAGLKLEREAIVQLRDPLPANLPPLTPPQKELMTLVKRNGSVTVDSLLQQLNDPQTNRWLNQLQQLGLLVVEDRLVERYLPKRESFVYLAPDYQEETAFLKAVGTLSNAPAQERIMLSFLALRRQEQLPLNAGIARAKLLTRAQSTTATLRELVKKGYMEVLEESVTRLEGAVGNIVPSPSLSAPQQRALEEITGNFSRNKVVLLHGVTGSGKTEIYIRLIEKCLAQGQEVLYLLPEIALTAQIVTRLRRVFGNSAGVYHSRQSDAERCELYERMLGKRVGHGATPIRIILGARSALFLPFQRLGLIIVDEEHETSYKQHSPAPRYHGRDLAIVLGKLHGASVLLGSATPSLESYSNARWGQYALVELGERYGASVLPEVRVVDMRRARHRKEANGHFSLELLQAIEDTLALGNQVILFQNRRGFSPVLQCQDCGWVPGCSHCDVSLTYHRSGHELICHYCGSRQPEIALCAACGSKQLFPIGAGTQRIEEELQTLIPQARIARLDLDTSRKKDGASTIIERFSADEIDVLIGTQMVSKGLDFKRVQLVGIINADAIIRMPDFRAFERAYQLMAQVGGRAGRRQEKGLVLIQAVDLNTPVLEWVKANDYKAFFDSQIEERQQFNYPPYCRLVKITLRHRDSDLVAQCALAFGEVLRHRLGRSVLGPNAPYISRVRNHYLQEILVKIERTSGKGQSHRQYIAQCIEASKRVPEYRNVQFIVDADPI